MEEAWNFQYLVTAAVAWVVAMAVNMVLDRTKMTGPNGWLDSGGMPSKHSAVVAAITIAVFLVHGIHSAEFAIAATFTALAMYDAMNVRRATGENRAAILALYDHVKDARNLHDEEPLRAFRSLGHHPAEVAVGALIGVLTAIVLSLFSF